MDKGKESTVPILKANTGVGFRFRYDEENCKRQYAEIECTVECISPSDIIEKNIAFDIILIIPRENFPDAWLPTGTHEIGMRGT